MELLRKALSPLAKEKVYKLGPAAGFRGYKTFLGMTICFIPEDGSPPLYKW